MTTSDRRCRTFLSFPRMRSVILAVVLIGSASQQKQAAFSCTAAAATFDSPPDTSRNRHLRRRRHHRRAQQQQNQSQAGPAKSSTFRCPEPSFVPFEKGVAQGLVDSTTLSEASGLVSSIINPGILWTHNDMGYQRHGGNGRGPTSTIIASRDDGTIARAYHLEGAEALDYEDIAAGSGPVEGQHYLYVGDIGGARGQRENIVVYRVAEPIVTDGDIDDGGGDAVPDASSVSTTSSTASPPVSAATEKVNSDGSISLSDWDALTLTYPGGHQHNAESLMYDPLTHHLYLISRDDGSIWRTERVWSEEGNATMNLVQVGTKKSQPLRPATGADVSRDGREVLVKHYASILYYCREPGEDLGMVLSTREGIKVPYKREIRGESVAFSAQRELGYYTLSESGGKGRDVPLYRYNRVPER